MKKDEEMKQEHIIWGKHHHSIIVQGLLFSAWPFYEVHTRDKFYLFRNSGC